MNNLQMWSLIVGFITPLVTAVAQQPKWSSNLRALVGFLIATVISLGTVYFNGSLSSVHDVIGSVLLVVVTSVSTYKHFWTPLRVAPAIESATSPNSYTTTVTETTKAAVAGRPGDAVIPKS